MKAKRVAVVLCVVAVFFTFYSIALGAEKVKIGVSLPLTGASASDGQNTRNGAALALEHNKSKPALQKYNIEIAAEDDKSDPKDAAAIGNKFAGDKEIFAVVGNYNSSCTLAEASILSKAGLVQISPASSSPKITGFSKYLFRTQPTDELVGANIVDWAKDLKFKKVAVVYENSDFGKGLQGVYEKRWPGEGRTIVATEYYTPGSTLDFTSILTKIKSAGAEGVLLGSLYQDAALMAKQAKQLGLKAQFFGDTSLYTQNLIDIGKESVNGWHMFGQWIPTAKDPLVIKFVEDFQKKYNEMPVVFAAQAYDAMLIILEGLAKNGPDREKLQGYVSRVHDFPGVTGKSTFKNGDVDKKLFRFTVVNGKFTQVAK